MPVEALQAELAAAGILKSCPAIELRECIAGGILVPPDPQQPPPWLAVRSALLATCVLPLASPALHARYDSARATFAAFARSLMQCCLQRPTARFMHTCRIYLLDPLQDTCSAGDAANWRPRQR